VSIAIDVDPEAHSIVLIGTYRSNEIDENHFLPTAIDILRKHDVIYQDIRLGQLSRRAVSDMIKDTVRITSLDDDFDMEALSEWVYTKTSGNAFFATHVPILLQFGAYRQMLQTLHDQGDLQFDFERRKWHFKIPDADNLPANVVDLIIRGLQNLPAETQAVIKLAACIGSNRFTLFLLSTVYQHSLEETATDLWPALKAGLIIPTSNAYQIPLAIEPGSELSQQWMNTTTTFEQDKLQQLRLEQNSDRTSQSANERQKGFVVTYRIS
jgi:osomolarity two-component system, sensor histidine kinase CHK1